MAKHTSTQEVIDRIEAERDVYVDPFWREVVYALHRAKSQLEVTQILAGALLTVRQVPSLSTCPSCERVRGSARNRRIRVTPTPHIAKIYDTLDNLDAYMGVHIPISLDSFVAERDSSYRRYQFEQDFEKQINTPNTLSMESPAGRSPKQHNVIMSLNKKKRS